MFCLLWQCQRHQMILANGQRAGFFIGDGAGVGKGRQVSDIVQLADTVTVLWSGLFILTPGFTECDRLLDFPLEQHSSRAH